MVFDDALKISGLWGWVDRKGQICISVKSFKSSGLGCSKHR